MMQQANWPSCYQAATDMSPVAKALWAIALVMLVRTIASFIETIIVVRRWNRR